MTIPVGVTIDVGAITVNAGTSGTTKVIVNGALNHNGAMTLAANSGYDAGPGAIIDLKGNTVTYNGTSGSTFAGTSGSHVTIQSTGGRGAFVNGGGTILILATWDYVDCSGLADSTLGRSQTSAVTQHYDHCTFTDMENIDADGTSTSTNAGFQWNYCNVRAPHTPTGTDYQPRFTLNNQALGTAPRQMIGNTWDGGTVLGKIQVASGNGTVTFTDNVIKNFQIISGDAFVTPQRNMFYNDLGSDQAFFLTTGGYFTAPMTNTYLYFDGGNHPLGVISSAVTAHDNIFECTAFNANWFLFTSNSLAISITKNIWLNQGTAMTWIQPASPTVTFSQNTLYISNNDTPPNQVFASGLEIEQTGVLTGTVSYDSNIHAFDTDPSVEEAVSCVGTQTGQVTTGNYNSGWSYLVGAPSPPVRYIKGTATTITPIAGLGVNDIAVNPQFADKSRKLATWDASLGGAGTAANAIAQMLKLNGTGGAFNASYTLTNLYNWVRAGFVPRNRALQGTGLGGVDIGAMSVSAGGGGELSLGLSLRI
jgi:hypothetical protein